MSFYNDISSYYSSIFPLNTNQVDFVLSSVSDLKNKTLLDIGCATGEFAAYLARHFGSVTGIDLDTGMINKARIKNSLSNLRFENLNMLNIASEYEEDSFDVIVCFGNTLVHLESAGEIFDFLCQSKKVLKPAGRLIIQIINYDRIIDNGINCLPVIENENIRFERTYENIENKIIFKNTLSVKKNNSTIANCIELYPIRRSEFEMLLKKAGFNDVVFYGSFKKEKPGEQSFHLVSVVF